MMHRVFVPVFLALTATAYAQKPPVQVKVVVDEPSDALFVDDAPKNTEVAPRGEGASNVITNTHVVNIVVNGASATAKPPAPDEEAELERDLEVGRERVREHRATQVEATRDAKPPLDRPAGVHKGLLMLSHNLGLTTLSGYLGAAAEVMFSNRLGLRLGGMFGRFGHDGGYRHDGEGLWSEHGERHRPKSGFWPTGGIGAKRIASGGTNIEELGLTFHLLPNRRFDLHAGLGVAHYGYDLRSNDGKRARGGAIYGRGNVGTGYFGSRFFATAGVTWMPFEISHYTVGDQTDSGREVLFDRKEQPLDARRLLVSTAVGFKFD